MWAFFHRRISPASVNFVSRLTKHRVHSGFRSWSRQDSPPLIRYSCPVSISQYNPSFTREASSLWTFAVSAVIIFGGLGFRHIYWNSDKQSITTLTPALDSFTVEETTEQGKEMATYVAPTGHVGNLTEEEEAKLREFWVILFKIFNIGNDELKGWTDNLSFLQKATSAIENASDKASVTENKKTTTKKRFGLFCRSTETAGEEAAPSGNSQANASDEDDKYGLNKEFFSALSSQSPEELRLAFWNTIKHDHPDGLLLRFLRARKWDVNKALVMLVSTLKWRTKEWHIDEDIMFKGEAAIHDNNNNNNSDDATKKEAQDMLQMLRIGEAYIRGKDKTGRPICYIRVRLHRIGAYCQSAIEKNIIFQIETSRLMLDAKTDTAVIVFDMTDFGLANMDTIPVKFIIKCFEANYPESLGAILVHKSPWIFSSFWSIIKGWLDPVVASKVHFTSNYQELEKFIAKDAIPKALGGNDNYEYEYLEPKAGENEKLKDTTKTAELKRERYKIIDEFQNATILWLNAADKGEEIKKQRQDIASRLSDFYWKLDPYIRARSIYDRIRDAEAAADAKNPRAGTPANTGQSPVSEKQESPESPKSQTQIVPVQPIAATAAAASN
ncbi:hypothetical protein GX48_06326 [Paracoccidioides brasiliensis]|nr:hypothetical protein GX48_06326 [Paracoccidioides brasiliensis]